jgi:hypothetical protein
MTCSNLDKILNCEEVGTRMTKEVEKDETREDEKYSGTENTRKIEETQ